MSLSLRRINALENFKTKIATFVPEEEHCTLCFVVNALECYCDDFAFCLKCAFEKYGQQGPPYHVDGLDHQRHYRIALPIYHCVQCHLIVIRMVEWLTDEHKCSERCDSFYCHNVEIFPDWEYVIEGPPSLFCQEGREYADKCYALGLGVEVCKY